MQNVKALLQKEYDFSVDRTKQASVYDTLELAIKNFDLAPKSDAYITFLMDVVHEVERKDGGNAQAFLEYWEKKKDALAITAPENVDAVRIMTVHKAKGLEFPIVIFPFANMDMYRRKDKKMWLPVNDKEYHGFKELLVNEKSEVSEYGEVAKRLFEEEEQKMALDAFNVLYVALTRAEKASYIVTEKEITKNGEHNTKHYSGLFIHYLKEIGRWQETENQYSFGNLENNLTNAVQSKDREYIHHHYSHKNRPSFHIVTRSGMLWDTERKEALEHGNLIHHLMGLIETEKDVGPAFDILTQNGDIVHEEIKGLKSRIKDIMEHPKLKIFFAEGNKVLNEKDILTQTGKLLRPDRIVLHQNRASIIDYKTGMKNPAYREQVYTYADALETMGYVVENKIIVYIDKNITPEFI